MPLIAIPINASLLCSLKSINCFPSFTLNRKLFKLYLYLTIPIFYYLNKIYSRSIKNESLEGLVKWADYFKKKQQKTSLQSVFIWSLVPNRKRYYIHFLDEKGNKIWFGKLTSNEDDFVLLKNEYQQLINIQSKRIKSDTFSTPQIIDFRENRKSCFLVTESLSKNYKLFHPSNNKFPEELSREIQGTIRKINIEQIFKLDWWINFESRKDEYRNLDLFIRKSYKNGPINVCFVHGDFGSENILIDKNGVFKVIDWERATNIGPYYVDHIAYWLGQNHKMLKKNSEKTIQQFYRNFLELNRMDLAFALCFLVAANFNLACIVAKEFKIRYEDII